ncbi:hypothetical protein CAPN001_13450 [Capnocytophaga stomatis]|uniref:hypothetical protein n=1 Tax=Capnocytophaga stomatis TaxID=1848904 RepID=UPI001950604B|nr:hypothetical protein [Capnocytophaga stomatis]GIJ96776.1 hypothetical protein CAPN001_13450 [Capnocytophaga stomatis]
MRYIDLKEISIKTLKQQKELHISIKNSVDDEKLNIINQKAMKGNEVFVLIFLSKTVTISVLEKISNVSHISLLPNYENPLENLNELSNFNLKSLILGSFTKKSISFKPMNCTNLEKLEFLEGLGNKSQYEFINKQKRLRKLHLKSLDLVLVEKNENLTDLYVHSNLKSENWLPEKFPNLQKLHLHGLSRLNNHSFIESLEKLESINISYNSHLVSFPKLNNPKLIKSIEMYTCPNFNDVESLLRYENLERLVLTSYDKPLQMSSDDFSKLKNLSKLKTVYTAWGKKSKDEVNKIQQIYAETGWINHQ